MALESLGRVAYFEGDYTTSLRLSTESLAIMRELQHRKGIADALNNLGLVANEQGDYQSARKLFEEGMVIRRARGDRQGIVSSLEGMAAVTAAFGSPPRAARIWGAAERLREEIGSPLPPNDRAHYDRRVAAARAALSNAAAFDRAWQEGRALMLEQAMDLALEETVVRP